ncbi:MAG: DUF1801 domain-containing protein, partial [Leptospiraceae bacterium]|nr:DUF1801 domain-containing protein [Leptospiraceae bacterium]
MQGKDTALEAFFKNADAWSKELDALRAILLSCNLEEEFKWRKPCYSAHGGNIAILQPFKAHLSLMFFKGALIQDSKGLLKPQGKNSQSAMRLEFTDVQQIQARASSIKSLVKKAMEIEKSGQTVSLKKSEDYKMPAELSVRFAKDPDYKKAFEALTPGRQ